MKNTAPKKFESTSGIAYRPLSQPRWREEIGEMPIFMKEQPNEYRKPKPQMKYAPDGTELGYIWQTAPGFDPFAQWREGWKKKPKSKKAQVQVAPKSKSNNRGYGEGRYMGD